MTLTLELPESIAQALAPLPEEERKRYAVELIEEGLNRSEPIINDRTGVAPLSEEDIAAVNRGIDDLFAGRHRSLKEVIALSEAKWNARGMSLKDAGRK